MKRKIDSHAGADLGVFILNCIASHSSVATTCEQTFGTLALEPQFGLSGGSVH
jgi:hypothetical protein